MRILKIVFLVSLLLAEGLAFAQSLSVEKIMQDPKWMGTFPSNISWDEKGETLYFNYNPEGNPSDSLYKINIKTPDKIEKVSLEERRSLIPSNADTNLSKTQKVYTSNGDLILFDKNTGEKTTLVSFGDRISNAKFLWDERKIAFQANNNIYVLDRSNGKLSKITRISAGTKPETKPENLEQREQWLKEDNLQLLEVVRQRDENQKASELFNKSITPKEPFTFYLGNKQLSNLTLSPDGSFVTFNLVSRAENKGTVVPDYTHVSGYTTNLNTRSKVGDKPSKIELAVYNLKKDTVYIVKTDDLPGIKDLPDYVKDYPKQKWEAKVREVIPSGVYFSKDGKYAVVNIRSVDNKDRWITLLDLEKGTLKSLDRQRDEAWISGPGIGWSMGGGTLGWLPDNKHIYFQSEETGYSHLYILDVSNGQKKQLTKGNFEIFDPKISNNGKFWYLSTSEVHPGERHYYMMPLMGGKMEKLTTMTGNNDVTLSPDEKYLAILYSYSNKPWEIYLQENLPNATPKQLTYGQSEEFKNYPWRDPKLVHFKAEDGKMVPARLYLPEPDKKNGAAVIFVHGAGYLQNVHKWWSTYFREYMFHNLLTDLGYTVLDIDYRGSAGYGRDWRTGIYRHMGGKDLSDQVDGAKYLVNEHGVDASRVGIYGGSYGGFITLMALFNASETFKSGAALRAVTDWAHYNHGYTSNILNEPFNDPIAYRRSSPIYFAEGFKGHLLIAHGMLDVNVHFQDVVRLAQRLIELGKDNWEMAVYPVEDHGFVEPSSWTDEYKRILKLFNDTLIN
ncbi:S9 family peptidase [Cecembia calidifontis]|uniref:Dipeptidyl aminopeptidase/acylaminoacyl peptidase n=1 Tax=Cecembia calidifontis TaxID=1187080 RepID=A0A4Q7PBP7_9BACT|nr:S9 family peptidase [Cecembia calidifontis]RZS97427.1 dipeptidyl aminopeptidase/acylaminoacyl peptidase [Cecembia calidifontis]